MKKLLFTLCLFSSLIGIAQADIFLDNANYLYVKTNNGNNTRAFGLNSSNHLYIGSVEEAINKIFFFNQSFGVMGTFLPNGNFGIGTATPTEKLEISDTNPTVKITQNPGLPGGGTLHITAAGTNSLSNSASLNLHNSGIWSQTGDKSIYFGYSDKSQTNVVFKQSGNVGIGTTSPDANLHVVRSNNLGNAPIIPGNSATFQNNTSAGAHSSINVIGGTDGITSLYLGDNIWGAMGGIRYNHSNNSLSLRVNQQDDYFSISSSGNVGVAKDLTWGTQGESKLLNEEGGSLRLAGTDINNKPYIEFHNKFVDGSPDATITLKDDNELSIESNRVSIGNITFDANNSSSRLIVDGKILCEEVQVVVNVDNVPPDYVFQKYYTGTSALKADYVMPTIEEVEAFTKENHHLPEVPSAEEIKDEGLQLKEMSMLLLQKVEELTLYTIEQEKRIKALEAQLAKKQ